MKTIRFCRNHYAGGTEYRILIDRRSLFSWVSMVCACIGILGLIWLLTK